MSYGSSYLGSWGEKVFISQELDMFESYDPFKLSNIRDPGGPGRGKNPRFLGS